VRSTDEYGSLQNFDFGEGNPFFEFGAAASARRTADFALNFEDLGSGVVNTTASRSGVEATFTRATDAYARRSNALWLPSGSGNPRSHYSASGEYLGYLAEGARTNLALQSNDFTNVAWTKSNMTAAKTATGPDGVVNSASTLTATAANGTALQAITSASASRIASVFIKRRTGTGVVNITQDNGSTWTAVTVTADWTQVSSTNQTLTNPTVGIRIVTDTDAVDVWCFMNEVATFASTPIPTTSATVTRNADVLTYPLADWYSATVGTVYAELSTFWTTAPANPTEAVLAQDVDGSLLYGSGADTEIRNFDGTNILTKTALAAMSTGVRKRASAWSGLTKVITGDGAAVASGTFDGTMGSGTTTNLCVGCDHVGTSQWFGTISRVGYWSRRFPDALLQAITA
jgi:hypothetical protein